MKLTKNFNLYEFTNSNVSKRLGIDNTPHPKHIESLQLLCANVLQPLRDTIGAIRITSGYRSKNLNDAIGGSWRSQHLSGEACDCQYHINGVMSNRTIIETIIKLNLPFDQLINEYNYSWVHISHRQTKNRQQLLEAYKVDGVTKYKVINTKLFIKN